MDRSSLENVADDRAYAFDPENVVDRSGAYRLNLPFDTSRDETYAIYKNEIDDTYGLRPDTADPTTDEEGLQLSNFVASVDEAPLSDAYLAELNKTVPLPDDDDARPAQAPAPAVRRRTSTRSLAALAPVLTADDFATLGELRRRTRSRSATCSRSTAVRRSSRSPAPRSTSASPRRSVPGPCSLACPSSAGVLGHYPDVPEAVTAIAALDETRRRAGATLFEYRYEQTPASVADIADEVTAMRQQMLLAKFWLPLGLCRGPVVAGRGRWSSIAGVGPSVSAVAEIDQRTRPAPDGRRPDRVTAGWRHGRDEDRSERGGSQRCVTRLP